MIKKDYIKIAQALHNFLESEPLSLEGKKVFFSGVSVICDALEEDNPRFDRKRFMDTVTVGK